MEDLVWHQQTLEGGVVCHHVGADDGKVEALDEVDKLSFAAVELMVPECHGVERKIVDDVCNGLAAMISEEEGTLSSLDVSRSFPDR